MKVNPYTEKRAGKFLDAFVSEADNQKWWNPLSYPAKWVAQGYNQAGKGSANLVDSVYNVENKFKPGQAVTGLGQMASGTLQSVGTVAGVGGLGRNLMANVGKTGLRSLNPLVRPSAAKGVTTFGKYIPGTKTLGAVAGTTRNVGRGALSVFGDTMNAAYNPMALFKNSGGWAGKIGTRASFPGGRGVTGTIADLWSNPLRTAKGLSKGLSKGVASFARNPLSSLKNGLRNAAATQGAVLGSSLLGRGNWNMLQGTQDQINYNENYMPWEDKLSPQATATAAMATNLPWWGSRGPYLPMIYSALSRYTDTDAHTKHNQWYDKLFPDFNADEALGTGTYEREAFNSTDTNPYVGWAHRIMGQWGKGEDPTAHRLIGDHIKRQQPDGVLPTWLLRDTGYDSAGRVRPRIPVALTDEDGNQVMDRKQQLRMLSY